jgi:hypothetical protein
MSKPSSMPFRRSAMLLASLLLVALPAAAGEIYQWKDANGVTHYTDSPPPDQEYKNRQISHNTAAPVQASEPAAEAVNDHCATARANLKRLEGEAPVGVDADGDGKPDSIMNAEQRASQKQLAQAAMNVHCTQAATPGSESGSESESDSEA